jgi:glutamine synthetase
VEELTMTSQEIIDAATAAGVQLVRFEYCDASGVARTKTVHVSQLAHKLVEGVGLTRAQMSINMLEEVIPIAGMEAVGEIRLVPDLDTFSVLPWVPASASILCDQLDHDRENWGACPRSFLKDMIGRAAQHGIVVQASFENEYYVARHENGEFVPFDTPGHAPVYSPIGHDLVADLMIETVLALQSQGMVVEQAINEFGAGQQEIAIRYSDALRCADNQMKFRDTVRGVAFRHNLFASFAPKPFPEEIGSGAHVHFSLWDLDGERNLLYDADADHCLSKIGRHFIAGIAEHLPALVALTAPSYNSYRRLKPSSWSSSTTAWGFDNKEAALRVTSPFFKREEQSFNIEFKPSDASANPYLSLGGLIACGLDGIERELDPGEPSQRNPVDLTPEELLRGKVRPLPNTMSGALDEFEKDGLLKDAFGDLLYRCYLGVRRAEDATFSKNDEAFELLQHFYRF